MDRFRFVRNSSNSRVWMDRSPFLMIFRPAAFPVRLALSPFSLAAVVACHGGGGLHRVLVGGLGLGVIIVVEGAAALAAAGHHRKHHAKGHQKGDPCSVALHFSIPPLWFHLQYRAGPPQVAAPVRFFRSAPAARPPRRRRGAPSRPWSPWRTDPPAAAAPCSWASPGSCAGPPAC